jgi:hypothetical protein
MRERERAFFCNCSDISSMTVSLVSNAPGGHSSSCFSSFPRARCTNSPIRQTSWTLDVGVCLIDVDQAPGISTKFFWCNEHADGLIMGEFSNKCVVFLFRVKPALMALEIGSCLFQRHATICKHRRYRCICTGIDLGIQCVCAGIDPRKASNNDIEDPF